MYIFNEIWSRRIHSSDQNAKFLIIGDDCLDDDIRITEEWKSRPEVNPEEEAQVLGRDGLEHDNAEVSGTDKSKKESEDNSMNAATGAGAGAGVLILAVAVFAVLRCRKENATKSENRESVDLNQQYGTDEYYQYMKHDTNVVDDNDMYNYGDCDYEE